MARGGHTEEERTQAKSRDAKEHGGDSGEVRWWKGQTEGEKTEHVENLI